MKATLNAINICQHATESKRVNVGLVQVNNTGVLKVWVANGVLVGREKF